jgi:ribosome modulation factor
MVRKLDTKAIEEGIDAYCQGVRREACPYPAATREHHDWLMGWEEAAKIDREDHPNPS